MTQEYKHVPFRNTTKIRGQRSNSILLDEFPENPSIIVNSAVEVKATAALSKEVAKELATDTEEVDMEELLDETDRGTN